MFGKIFNQGQKASFRIKPEKNILFDFTKIVLKPRLSLHKDPQTIYEINLKAFRAIWSRDP